MSNPYRAPLADEAASSSAELAHLGRRYVVGLTLPTVVIDWYPMIAGGLFPTAMLLRTVIWVTLSCFVYYGRRWAGVALVIVSIWTIGSTLLALWLRHWVLYDGYVFLVIGAHATVVGTFVFSPAVEALIRRRGRVV